MIGPAAMLLTLAAGLGPPAVAAAGNEGLQSAARTFDVRIERRRVPQAERVLRATEGDRVELRWSADEPLVLHLHGYDIETRVEPGKQAVTAFTARLTGRFPVAIHAGGAAASGGSSGRGSSHHHHVTLLHVEVHPK